MKQPLEEKCGYSFNHLQYTFGHLRTTSLHLRGEIHLDLTQESKLKAGDA